jgi:hypothetical protein
MPLKETEEPTASISNTETALDPTTFLTNDMPEPILRTPRIEMDEAKLHRLKVERQEPSLMDDRTETLDPRLVRQTADNLYVDPRLTKPATLRLDEHLANCLKEKEDPN